MYPGKPLGRLSITIRIIGLWPEVRTGDVKNRTAAFEAILSLDCYWLRPDLDLARVDRVFAMVDVKERPSSIIRKLNMYVLIKWPFSQHRVSCSRVLLQGTIHAGNKTTKSMQDEYVLKPTIKFHALDTCSIEDDR
jgi:hypothetical protein